MSLLPSSRKRKTVSCREYYVYKLQIREQDKSYILRFGRLLKHCIVANYVKLETMRLDFFTHSSNQKRLRRENYQGLIDSVVAGVQQAGKIGKRVYLPSTFIGGPRDMRHRYLTQ
ncbi:hypothetical protein LIER_38786 [Lithospermum erythrorhizon]|uniref:Helitron helicase-like domain-containing protein n=1 Tax=Lithospermum erythrorhizon TaxID=34254 RepID=A0AAV3Q4R8_LITER